MTIYVDEIRTYPQGRYSHLWTDGDQQALDDFAARLGLKRQWKHHSRGLSGEFSHYDVTPSKRALALKRGAQFKPLKEWILERTELPK